MGNFESHYLIVDEEFFKNLYKEMHDKNIITDKIIILLAIVYNFYDDNKIPISCNKQMYKKICDNSYDTIEYIDCLLFHEFHNFYYDEPTTFRIIKTESPLYKFIKEKINNFKIRESFINIFNPSNKDNKLYNTIFRKIHNKKIKTYNLLN